MTRTYKKNEYNLPFPRVQIRMKRTNHPCKFNYEYSLIRKVMHGVEETVLTKGSFSDSGIETSMLLDKNYTNVLHQLKPKGVFNEMLYDMWQMKVPAYMVSKEGFEEIKIEEQMANMYNGVWILITENKDPSRRKEVKKLIEINAQFNEERAKKERKRV